LDSQRIDGVVGHNSSFYIFFSVLLLRMFFSRQVENDSPNPCDAHCTTVIPLFANERVYVLRLLLAGAVCCK
jgi:hypothetical protein